MSDMPANRRGADAGGREGTGDATTVLSLVISVRAPSAREPTISSEDSP